MEGLRLKFAVLLSGCGFADGSEIHEAVFCLQSLERNTIEAVCLAPNIFQTKVVNLVSNCEGESQRNILEESARIARGKIQNLNNFDISLIDGLVIPGGFGVALNLSNFAIAAQNIKVHPEVETLIRDCHRAGKPIGAVCIAPVLLAKVLGQFSPVLTVGDNKEIEECLEALGAKMKKCPKGDCVVDHKNKLASSPAYMYEKTSLKDVSDGIEKMIQALL